MVAVMTEVKISEGCTLHCPACGSDCGMHQIRARVGFRRREDEPLSLVTTIDKDCTASEFATISGRRDQVSVMFSCESCSRLSELKITQHKGQTLVHWGL
jgi:hypothetical protein